MFEFYVTSFLIQTIENIISNVWLQALKQNFNLHKI